MAPSYEIVTDRLYLKVIDFGDADDVFTTMNSPETARQVSFMSWPMTKAQALDWCQKAVRSLSAGTAYLFIARDDEKRPVGCLGVHPEDNGRTAEIGYWITEGCQGRGYATEMAGAAVSFAIETLGLASLFATTAQDNDGSARVLEKAGFFRTGETSVPLADGGKRPSYLYELKA